MRKFDLQIFAADVIQGKKIVYLYRVKEDEATLDGAIMAFTTENERTKSKDADTTQTKDGPIRTPGTLEQEITATAILTKGSELIPKLEAALDEDKLIEIWEANLAEPVQNQQNQFKGKYFQGYLTELSYSSNAEDMVEVSTTFGINGKGADGNVTVTAEQQDIANYVFRDTTKTGA